MELTSAISLIDNATRKNDRIYSSDFKKLIKQIPKSNNLAIKLWDINYKESRLIAIHIAKSDTLPINMLEKWVKDLDSWWLTDALACHLVKYIPNNINLAKKWIKNEDEFIRRAGFATVAQIAWTKNDIKDDVFLDFLPLIQKYSTDDRFYVKKAVNWLLRDIGKRNLNLQKHCLELASILKQSNNKTAKWIATHKMNEVLEKNK